MATGGDLPDEVRAALVRGIAAFARVAQPQQLPPEIRRFRGWRTGALKAHSGTLLEALDNEDFRTAVLEWLDDGRPPLSRADADVLRTAAELGEGWAAQLAPARAESPDRPPPQRTDVGRDLEREQERTKRARSELRRAKERARAAEEAARRVSAELTRVRDQLNEQLESARNEAVEMRSKLSAATEERDRRVRRATRDAAALRGDLDRTRTENRNLRRSLSETEAELRRLREPATKEPVGSAEQPGDRGMGPRPRRPLRVPKGRLYDDPGTLDEWLDRGPWLLVDGYNVTKAEGGYANLVLEAQRDRLIEEVEALARRKQVHATIVFDGSRVPPGTKRRRKGAVAVEYSRPEELADDHLIALLEDSSDGPAVLVTNDRDLQQRAAARGATIATSDQLLALIR